MRYYIFVDGGGRAVAPTKEQAEAYIERFRIDGATIIESEITANPGDLYIEGDRIAVKEIDISAIEESIDTEPADEATVLRESIDTLQTQLAEAQTAIADLNETILTQMNESQTAIAEIFEAISSIE